MTALLPPRARHILLAAVAAMVFAMLAGATYQGVATAVERRQFPHPGRLVDIGSHQLHIHCIGTGTPTVVLESPAAGLSAGWGWISDALARTTRVCSYDRAGLGWSEAGDLPYDPARVPDDLHVLLARAGERGPFVITGHGLGAAFARMYASRYRDATAAIVLVDEPALQAGRAQRARMTRLLRASPWLARAGMLRATQFLSRYAAGLPGDSGGAMRTFLNRPDHLTRAAQELQRMEATVERAATEPLDPSLPVIEVSAGSRDPLAVLASSEQAERVTQALEAVILRLRQVRSTH